MYSVNGLFENILTADLLGALKGAEITVCDLSTEQRTLNLQMTCENYVNADFQKRIKESLCAALKLNGAFIKYTFSPSAFCSAAAEDLINVIKYQNMAFNGFLNDSTCAINGKTLTVTLKYGGLEKLESNGFSDVLIREIKKNFDILVDVKFDGQLEDIEIKHEEEPVYVPVSKNEKPKEAVKYDYAPKGGLPIYIESAEKFFGRSIKTNIKPLADILPPTEAEAGVFVCGWGEVFSVESKNINTRRGGKMAAVSFSLYDGTNAIKAEVKKFFDPKYVDDMEAEATRFLKSMKKIADGQNVIVNGKYGYDSYKKDYVLSVTALATVQKYFEKDNYDGEKRVELHCHTNMSAKDAVCSAGDIIKQAYSWGHKAVAITDHGVVQAYPAVAKAMSKIPADSGFKAIYGVESYFIDDIRHDISGKTPKELSKMRNHQIILVKNLKGLRNLYELVSDAHLNHFYGRPVTLRSKLDTLREGLIIGSACEQGELYRAIVDGKSDQELLTIADYYDYLEIQPLGNNEFMIRESALPDKVDKRGNVTPNRFKDVVSFEVIKNFNRKVVELADKLGKPVVATGDVHFLKKEDGILRKIILAGQGFEDIENQAPLYFKTTEEMLNDFEYFGERAKEFVIDNPQKIADMISNDVIPVPKGNYPPSIEGSDEDLRRICMENAHNMYGNPLPEIVEKRLKKELDSIINNGFSVMYMSAQKLVEYSEKLGYLVGSRGSVGSSFVATMSGISEVNPLPPHYVCKNCKHSEFFTDGSVGSGFDLPEKKCPECGADLDRNGHDIPFETFLGFKGDKVPDIDLNFSDEVQNRVQDYTKTLFGSGNVYKAGTVSTVAEKTAYGFTKAYIEKTGVGLSGAAIDRLAKQVEKAEVKTTSGQHPAGMIVVPEGMSIYDFCPVQHPADDVNSDIITTHFDFHSIHDTILKLDELGHVVPTTYKYLEEYSGIPVNDVSMSDSLVYSLFTSPEALGVTPDMIYSKTGTLCLPEFGTRNTRDMLLDSRPQNFADLLQISGLSHGTGVWHGNAKDLIDNGTCTISNVIGTRDNIMVYLIHMGMDEGTAFSITETVRKGKYAKGEISEEDWAKIAESMRAVNVPEWYIESCKKIEYMFPKAHAAAYVISALRLAWYKVYKPLAFYCAYFTARPEDVDVHTVLKGIDAVKAEIKRITELGNMASPKEKAVLGTLMIFNELMSRGIEVLPIDIYHSHAVKYVPEDGKIRLPFGSLAGVGDKQAYSIYEAAQKGNFVSREDFAIEAGVSKTIIQNLSDIGALGELPDSNQISMF